MITTEPNYNALVVIDHDQVMQLYSWFDKKLPNYSTNRNMDRICESHYISLIEASINIIIAMYKDLPTTQDLRVVDYFEEFDLGEIDDPEIMAFEAIVMRLIPLFPDEIKRVKYLMRKDKLQYWYATTDLERSLACDGALR